MEPNKLTPEQIKQLRDFYTQQRTALNALVNDLEEPLLSMFKGVEESYNSVLSSLPMTDAVPAAQQASYNLQSLYSCMMAAQGLNGMLVSGVTAMKAKVADLASKAQTAMASVAGKAEEIISQRITAGELVPKSALNSNWVAKDAVKELTDVARNEGLAAGKLEAQGEFAKKEERLKLIGERTKQVQTCSLPIPAEDILALEQGAFDTAVATAKTRAEVLTKKRVGLNGSLGKNVWGDPATWANVEELVKDMRGGPEPLMGLGSTPAGEKPRVGAL